MSHAANRRLFRIFVSSTFKDMEDERNALHRVVFPEVKKYCRERGFRFQTVDLRWGVSEEAGVDQRALAICLTEVARCREISPQLNFLALVGDRYGWEPLPACIPAAHFEALAREVSSPGDHDLLHQWYRLDENAVPAEFVLLGCDGERAGERGDWAGRIEPALRRILRRALEGVPLEELDVRRFVASATEQEIRAGALDLSLGENNALFFLRRLVVENGEEAPAHFRGVDPAASAKQERLRAEIARTRPGDTCEYTATWTGEHFREEEIAAFCEAVKKELIARIEAVIAAHEEVDPLDAEIAEHRTFARERAEVLIGRDSELARIEQHLAADDNSILVLHADGGAGKSAVMAAAALRAAGVSGVLGDDCEPPPLPGAASAGPKSRNPGRERHAGKAGEQGTPQSGSNSARTVLLRFIGASSKTSSSRDVLQSLCVEVARTLALDETEPPAEFRRLVDRFHDLLGKAGERGPVALFIDALDQLPPSDEGRELNWLPRRLPRNVRVVVSVLDGSDAGARLKAWESAARFVPLATLGEGDGAAMLDSWLAAASVSRALTAPQRREILAGFQQRPNPLYLRLVFEEARLCKSFDPAPVLPNNVAGVVRHLLARLCEKAEHGEHLVSHALGYLSAARTGLTEEEVIDVLTADAGFFSRFRADAEKYHKLPEPRVPDAVWSRLYFDLRPYLRERSVDEVGTLGFFHRVIGEVVAERFLPPPRAPSIHGGLARYFAREPNLLPDPGSPPPARLPNLRRLSELAYQQTLAQDWDGCTKTLTDLSFIEAACRARPARIFALIPDYDFALDALPETRAERAKAREQQGRCEEYGRALIEYAMNPDGVRLPEIASVAPLAREEIKKRGDRARENPNRGDRMEAFASFVRGHAYTLKQFGARDGFVVQQSLNSADGGPLADAGAGTIESTGADPGGGPDHHEVPMALVAPQDRAAFDANPSLLTALIGHTGSVSAVAVSADGRVAVSGGADGSIRVWNLETGEERAVLHAHGRRRARGGERIFSADGMWGAPMTIGVLSITADGGIAVSGGMDGSIRIWNLRTMTDVAVIESVTGRTEGCTIMAATADARMAAVGQVGGRVRLWDLVRKLPLSLLKFRHSFMEPFCSIALTPCGRIGIVGMPYSGACVFDTTSGEVLARLGDKETHVTAVTMSPDGEVALIGQHDGTLRAWNVKNSKESVRLVGHANEISGVAVTADGRVGLSSDEGGVIRVWDLVTGAMRSVFEGHTDRVNAIAMTPDGRFAVSAGLDGVLRIWDLSVDKGKPRLVPAAEVSIWPTGSLVYSAHDDGSSQFRDFNSISEHAITEPGDDEIFEYTPSRDGFSILSTSKSGQAWVYDQASGDLTASLADATEAVPPFAVTGDGRVLLSAALDGTVRAWDLAMGHQLLRLKGHGILKMQGTDEITCLAVTPNGRVALSGSADGTVRAWDLANGAAVAVLESCETQTIELDRITSISVIANGCWAVIGDSAGRVRLWNLDTYEERARSTGHSGRVVKVSTTPDGGILASAGDDGTIRVWNLTTGDCVLVADLRSPIRCLSEVTQNRRVVAGLADGRILRISLPPVQVSEPYITATRIWRHDSCTESRVAPIACCVWCNARFAPPLEMLQTLSLPEMRGSSCDAGSRVQLKPIAALGKVRRIANDVRRFAGFTLKLFPAMVQGRVAEIFAERAISTAVPATNLKINATSEPESSFNSASVLRRGNALVPRHSISGDAREKSLCVSCPECSRPLRFNPYVCDSSAWVGAAREAGHHHKRGPTSGFSIATGMLAFGIGLVAFMKFPLLHFVALVLATITERRVERHRTRRKHPSRSGTGFALLLVRATRLLAIVNLLWWIGSSVCSCHLY
ncbi:MAG: DUF4062 domain-containing protein [Planctomycetes bacterium]|nr:DUF4062 domain-containing protein [Planctomycetota bacterium]